MKNIRFAVLGMLLCSQASLAQKPNTKVTALKVESEKQLQSKYEQYKGIALSIWDHAELGYKEQKSAALLEETLRAAGFVVESGTAGIPTSFVATYGSGKPVIGVLAEYDALPGMSQTNLPKKESAGKDAGHACGHHLLGTAGVAAGIELKRLIEEKKITGTIKVFGCPAEEGGSGKVYMVRDGLFKDVDVALHWHPHSENRVMSAGTLAVVSAKFRFHGQAAHAAAAPEKGRSALDGVEAMNDMVNMMREHTPREARIHYVITNGGKAPNVVPDFSEVYYYVRHPSNVEAAALFERVVKAAKGAAMGTETTVEYEIIGGTHELLLNKSLAEVMQQNFERIGGVGYTPQEAEYAKSIQSSFTYTFPDLNSAAKIHRLNLEPQTGTYSTDVGDVSYMVPTVGAEVVTWVPGTALHSWQAVASGGTDIGIKGMMVAAKVLSATAIDLFTNPAAVEKAKLEFKNVKGPYTYKSLLGDRKPALNYRD